MRLPLWLLLLTTLILQRYALAQVQAKADLRTLTVSEEIARWPSIDPKEQPPVRFEGTITFVDPTGTVFLQDEKGSTFIRASNRGKSLRPGQRILVTGMRYPGLFIGGIVPDQIEVLGEAPLPTPHLVTPNDLASARYHYQLVEIEGVGRSLEETGESTATLKLNVQDKIIDIRFDKSPENTLDFIDATLRVRGLAAGSINDRRQLVAPYIRLADSGGLSIVKAAPAEPFAAAALPLPALLDAATTKPSPHRIKLHGTALSGLLSGGFFLREDTRSVYVKTNQISSLQAGDEVEALGFAQMDVFSAILSDANFRVMAQGEPPTPRAVGAKELTIGECDAELISVDALILQNLEAENAFLIQVGKYPMKVICSQGKLPNADIGSLARFNGLCRVKGIKDEGYRASPTSYELWLRSPKDMMPLSSAPWWTVRRLAYLVGVIGCIAILASAWIALLRRQVNKQLTMLQTKTQTEAIMEERQRIAREFHDTLEQELAGLSIRLDAVATRVSDDKARGLLEQQRRLLTRLQSETRDFVWDLRDPARTDLPLDEALSALLDHLRTNTEIPLQFKSEGPIKALPALVQHHLLRIVREAVNNAIKYSKASQILISLDTQSDLLNLSVEDDGAGFDEQIANQLEGHFGIRGMKERARKIGADFNVCSSPGSGTSVELTLALTA